MLLVALLPLGIFLTMWIPDRRLAGGPHAESDVVRVESVRRSSKGLPQTTKVAVRFSTAEGRVVDTTLRTTRVRVGSTLALTYDANHPERVRAVDGPEQAWRVPLVIGLVVVAFASIPGWLAVRLRLGRPSRGHLQARRVHDDDVPPLAD